MASSASQSPEDSLGIDALTYEKIVQHITERQLSSEDVEKFYDTWAVNYDKDHERFAVGRNHPRNMAENVEKLVKDKNTKILDVACGTGRVGQYLKEKGFTNVDGIDGSKGMLEVARSHRRYKNYFHEFITESSMKSVPVGSYDVVITTGSFEKNHFTSKNLRPVGLCIKQGGLGIFAVRSSHLKRPEFEDLEPTLTELEKEGFWKLEQKLSMENHSQSLPGITYVLEKL